MFQSEGAENRKIMFILCTCVPLGLPAVTGLGYFTDSDINFKMVHWLAYKRHHIVKQEVRLFKRPLKLLNFRHVASLATNLGSLTHLDFNKGEIQACPSEQWSFSLSVIVVKSLWPYFHPLYSHQASPAPPLRFL